MQRAACLAPGVPGRKRTDFHRWKHISRACEICLWLICPFMSGGKLLIRKWTAYCSFANRVEWNKINTLMLLAWTRMSSGPLWVHLSSSPSIYPCIPVSDPGRHWLVSERQDPLVSSWQHVADRLSSVFSFTTVHSPALASILTASKTSGTEQQTKTQPQLTEWTAGLQPERSLILVYSVLCLCVCP